jgi:hypothetical protein
MAARALIMMQPPCRPYQVPDTPLGLAILCLPAWARLGGWAVDIACREQLKKLCGKYRLAGRGA